MTIHFTDTLTQFDVKRHIPHVFSLPDGVSRLKIHLHFDPAQAGDARNMLTLTIFDPNGFRGAGHRGGQDHVVEIRPDGATPGYLPGPLPAGAWTAQIDSHMIGPDAVYCHQHRLRTGSTGSRRPPGNRAASIA
ncbi:MAG: hypothetical protein R2856_20580 [Caldilineaceae bacterium]